MEKLNKLGAGYKAKLHLFAEHIQADIVKQIIFPRISLKQITIRRSHSFGWWTPIGKISGIPGQLELWIDLCPNIGRPVLSVCYYTNDLERIKKVSEASTTHLDKIFCYANGNIIESTLGQVIHAQPLPQKYFSVPIIESFTKQKYGDNFLIIYLPQSIDSKSSILNAASKMSVKLIRSIIAATEVSYKTQNDFSAVENRNTVKLHIARERSQKLASLAKIRDGFSCQVCGFNYTDDYGVLGRGFAEAHHKAPLSQLRKNVQTKASDLITVCANCHRMLHRMQGIEGDVKRLQNLVKKIGKN